MALLKWLDKYIEELLLVLLAATMVTVVFTQVFMRFVLSYSLPWSEELARYCFIWIVYIGISYGVKKQRHIKVEVIHMLLKGRSKYYLGIFSNLIFLCFAVFLVVGGFDVAKRLLDFGQLSPALGMSMSVVYLATPVGMFLTSIRILQQLFLQFKLLSGKNDLL